MSPLTFKPHPHLGLTAENIGEVTAALFAKNHFVQRYQKILDGTQTVVNGHAKRAGEATLKMERLETELRDLRTRARTIEAQLGHAMNHYLQTRNMIDRTWAAHRATLRRVRALHKQLYQVEVRRRLRVLARNKPRKKPKT